MHVIWKANSGSQRRGNQLSSSAVTNFINIGPPRREFTVWRCSMARKLKCKANVVSDGRKVVRVNNDEHNHEGCIAKYRAKAAVCKMKALMSATTGGPSAIQGAVSADLPDDVLMALPRKSTLTRTLRRHNRKNFVLATSRLLCPPICCSKFRHGFGISFYLTQDLTLYIY